MQTEGGATIDLDAFFLEQDQRMNMPDDDFDEYLKRIGYKTSEETRRMPVAPAHGTFKASKDLVHSRVQTSYMQQPTTDMDEIHAPQATGSLLHSDQHASVTDSPNVDAHPNDMLMHEDASTHVEPTTQTLSLHDPQPSSPLGVTSLLATAETHNSSYSEYQSTPRVFKRKVSEDSLQSRVLQKRRNESPRLVVSPSSSIEEITSFRTSLRTSPRTKKRPISLLEESQELSLKSRPPNNVPKSPKKRKINALKLQPLAPAPAKVTAQDELPTSPIEDASSLFAENDSSESTPPARKMPKHQSGPSRLYLDVKERVAKHATLRRRGKVIKLAKKDLAADLGLAPDESSVIYMSSAPSSRSSSLVPGPSSSTKAASKRAPLPKPEKAKAKSTKSKKKGKLPPMIPAEYVRHLQERTAQEVLAQESEKGLEAEKPNKRSPFKFLHGKSIFYAGGDMTYASERTRGRMDCIVKYGGNLLAAYDPAVTTHIVTDAQALSTLRALGLKKLNEIPNHIPTIKWDWIAKAIGRTPILSKEGVMKVRMDELFMHAAFSERIDAGPEPAIKGKGKTIANEDISRISEFTQDKPRRQSTARSIHDSDDQGDESDEGGLGYNSTGVPPSPPTSPHRAPKPDQPSSSRTSLDKVQRSQPDDPLAEFYAKARAERDSGWSRHGEVEESDVGSDDEINEPIPKAVSKRGWTCDTKEVQRQTCVNQDIIDKLQELKDLHQSKPSDDDRWRVFSYSKCIQALRNHPKRIESFAEARAIRGVGEKTAAKIMEIIETGGLRRISYERTDDVKATRLFQGIYGVGQSTAFKWYASGCRTLDDILEGKGGIKLTPAQEIGIRFYDDINDRMPREEAKAIFDLIKPIALKIDPKLFVEIMGSYRRGKADCGDIDIIITRPPDDGKTHKGVLSRLLQDLHAAGILTEDLALPEDPDDLEAIYRGLCRVPKEGARRRRIDFLTVPWQSRGAALLYYTGDDIFNRAIRWKAGAMGYSLNQKGLFSGVVRDPRDRRVKLNTGTLVASETEEAIFRILNVPWQEPRERVRG